MKSGSYVNFVATVLVIWAAMHAYVFWRGGSVPWIKGLIPAWAVFAAAALLWLSYPLARVCEARGYDLIGLPLEFFAANWVGTLFLLVAAMLAADVLTLGGWVFRAHAPLVRGWAVLLGLGLAALALVQGLRAPVVCQQEVRIPGLPAERDGLVVVQISDLHLGTLIGERWIARLVDRVNDLHPDLILAVGDIVDANATRVVRFIPALRKLQAPLGVYAVTGNHEFYAGLEASVVVLRQSGFKVLRDEWTEVAPGLVLAGVDDLTAKAHSGRGSAGFDLALAGRPPGATVLMSHTPWEVSEAARLGVNLMLSGHTHNGQIWPFTYLVKMRYPYVGGRYEVDGMPLIVCTGTGTWGPRMRLWRPSEIVRISLRKA